MKTGSAAVEVRPPPGGATGADRLSLQDFIGLLERSQLIPQRQLEAMRSRVLAESVSSARDFAQTLVEAGHLTRWQADRLLSGKAGFILGRYRLIDRIGSGGMAVVLKGQQIGLTRTVAIKVLARTLLRRQDAVKRFFREIEAASALDHQNIVRAIDSACIDGVPFLVMEYVEGRDLHSFVDQRGPLPIALACEFCRQAALGLQHAFERDVVHRDIKPANLLATRRTPADPLVVKILDFGLARFASDAPEAGALTHANQIFGTVDFISPEQARSARAADTRSDIFSLGCTLFFLLTGKTPFHGETAMEKLTSRIADHPAQVRSLRPEIPAELEAVISTMLARDPADRYQIPAEVAAALAPFTGAPPDGEEAAVLARREPRTAAAASESELALENFLGSLAKSAPPVEPPSSDSVPSRRGSKSSRALVTLIVLAVLGLVAAALMMGPERIRNQINPREVPRTPPASMTAAAGTPAEPASAELVAWPGEEDGLIVAWHRGLGTKVTGHTFAPIWGLNPTGDAQFDADGTLIVGRGSAELHGPEEALREECRRTGELSLEMAFSPDSLRQSSGRIVSFGGKARHNFVLGQVNDDLVLRLLTSKTASSDSPAEVELCKLKAGQMRHVLVSYRDGQLDCYVDGDRVSERSDLTGDFSVWAKHDLQFGDDAKSPRGWAGRVERFALYGRFLTAQEARRQFLRSQQPEQPTDP